MATRMVIVTIVILPTVLTDARACCRKTPFQLPDLSCDVARLLGNLCQEDIIGTRLKTGRMNQFRNLTLRQIACTQPVIQPTLGIGPCPVVAIVETCQHTGTGGGAKCTTVGVVESHPFVCETVDIRCLEMPLSIATQHTASEIVAINENDIRVIGHTCWLSL